MKNMQIAALKRKVWDSDNELNQVVHERDWFRTKTKARLTDILISSV